MIGEQLTQPETCWCGNEGMFQDVHTLKTFCAECASDIKHSSENVHAQLVKSLSPYNVGDLVDCYQAGDEDRYVGTGFILFISDDLEEGGTPTYPVFRVGFRELDDKWFTAICLRHSFKKDF